jgi:hypothetical protein
MPHGGTSGRTVGRTVRGDGAVDTMIVPSFPTAGSIVLAAVCTCLANIDSAASRQFV